MVITNNLKVERMKKMSSEVTVNMIGVLIRGTEKIFKYEVEEIIFLLILQLI